ncbi:MAG TPA: cytochrome c oxidase subunit 3 [Candidatus Acidoferrales bacterium]
MTEIPGHHGPSQTAVLERETSRSGNGNRMGGGPGDPIYEPHRISDLEPKGTPLSAYRMITFLAMFWIAALFATLALVLESRWVHSTDWVSIPLPRVLYLNSAILLGSSLTIEFARLSRRAGASKETRWIRATLLLGVVFIAGQIAAWQELISRGLHLASNPGSFFFFLITGAHGLTFVAAMISLISVSFLVSPTMGKVSRQTALHTTALYWHFMTGLWACLFVLLLVTLQR